MDSLPPESIHLVVTSPPCWTLKEYRDSEGQIGHIEVYSHGAKAGRLSHS
jgi:hypothetical protein